MSPAVVPQKEFPLLQALPDDTADTSCGLAWDEYLFQTRMLHTGAPKAQRPKQHSPYEWPPASALSADPQAERILTPKPLDKQDIEA